MTQENRITFKKLYVIQLYDVSKYPSLKINTKQFHIAIIIKRILVFNKDPVKCMHMLLNIRNNFFLKYLW